jgi:hypothetical protein
LGVFNQGRAIGIEVVFPQMMININRFLPSSLFASND